MKKYILLFVCLFVSILMYAQDDEYIAKVQEFPYKSPEVAAFQRYGEYSINEYTGNPNIQIPLYELKCKGVNIPLSLSYDASGIKVDQEASWVGLGWNMMVGGCITYVPAGQVDIRQRMGEWEDYKKSYDCTFPFIYFDNSNYMNSTSVNPECFSFLNGLRDSVSAEVWRDRSCYYDVYNGLGERDYYSASFLGKTLMFFFDPFTCEFKQIGKNNEKFKIEEWNGLTFNDRTHSDYPDQHLGFMITDGYGNKYIFQNTEVTYCGRGSSYRSAWNLSQIITSQGEYIDFNYSKRVSVCLIPKLSECFDFMSMPNHGVETMGYGNSFKGGGYHRFVGGGNYRIEKSYLTSIVTDQYTVLFKLQDGRKDLSGGMYVDSLIVKSTISGKMVKSYRFGYDYFQSDTVGGNYMSEFLSEVKDIYSKRLKLTYVDELSNTSETLRTSFEYDARYLPLKTSYATDFWGYYNGKENNNNNSHIEGVSRTSLPKASLIALGRYGLIDCDIIRDFEGANRLADRKFMGASVLRKIQYPTMGYTEFEYEPNNFEKDDYFYPEQSVIDEISANRLKSYTTEGKFISAGASVNDSNIDNVYMPQYRTIFVDVDADCEGQLMISMSGSSSVNLRTLKYDGAYVKLISQVNGHSWTYTPSELVDASSDMDTSNRTSHTFSVELKKGRYVLQCNLPDSYGKNSSCSVSARLSTSKPSYEAMRNALKDKNLPSVGGGLRIKKIKNYSDGQLHDSICYSYGGGKLLCPMIFGKFEMKCDFHDIISGRESSYECYRLSSSSLAGCTSFTSSTSSGVVGYDNVTTRYFEADGHQVKKVVSTYSNEKAKEIVLDFYQFENSSNGSLLTQTVYDSFNNIVSSVRNTYYVSKQAYTCNIRMDDRAVCDPCSMQHISFYSPVSGVGFCRFRYIVYSYYAYTNDIIKSIQTNYDGAFPVSTIHEYTYNPQNLQITSDISYSDADSIRYVTNYKYIIDSDDDVQKNMVESNMVNMLKSKTIYRESLPIKGLKYSYSSNSVGLFYKSAESYSHGTSPLEERVRYTVNRKGNVESIVKDNIENVVYLWSYGGEYPIAEIKGVTKKDIEDILSQAYINNLAKKAMPDYTDLEDLHRRLSSHNIQVTGYLYEPGVGVKMIMFPNAQCTYYEYDGFNRLKSVRNSDHEIITTHKYNYSK